MNNNNATQLDTTLGYSIDIPMLDSLSPELREEVIGHLTEIQAYGENVTLDGVAAQAVGERLNQMSYAAHNPEEFKVQNEFAGVSFDAAHPMEFDVISSPYDLSAELMPLIANGHTVDGQSQLVEQEISNNIVPTNGVLGKFTAQIQHERGEISDDVAVSHGLTANALSGRSGMSIS